jgi:Transposase DDE domain
VRGPIEFDGKFCAHAEEVGEVGTDRVLPAELEAIDLASSQALPERRFGASRIVAVMTSENDLTTQSTFHQLERNVTPHVAQNTSGRRSAIDARTTAWPGYSLSQKARKRIEEIFGWMKVIGGFRKTRFRGLERTQLAAYFIGAAYNLLRVARLLAA